MNLKYLRMLLIGTFLLCGCSGSDNHSSSVSSSSYSTSSTTDIMNEKEQELLTDPKFTSGFNLMTTSTENGRTLSKVIDYDGEALSLERRWFMAQWWSHQDFGEASCQKLGDKHYYYENESRSLDVNTETGTMKMELNSYTEYMAKFGHSRDGSENWSHFLIEQDFKEAPMVCELERVDITLDFSIDMCDDMDSTQQIPAAQFLWYFTVTDVKNGNTGYESGNNDFFWFGVPMFDNRYDFLETYRHVDSGFVGATNKLIYSMASDTYLDEKIQYKKTYHINFNILPYIKEAYLYGVQNGAMPNSNWVDLCLNYMNLGWELPGSYHVKSTISNLSVKVTKK